MTKYTGFDVAFRSTDLSVAIELNISSIFTMAGTTNMRAFALLFDALLQTDYVEPQQLPSGFRYLKRKGCGLRMAIQIASADTDVKLNVLAVAAQTKLHLGTSSYRVEGIGVSSDVLAAFLGLPISGSFDDNTFKLVRSAVAETLPHYLENENPGTGDYSVPLPSFLDDPVIQARGICYAASMVGQRKKLSAALSSKPSDIQREAVLAGYSRFAVADFDRDPQPTNGQATQASQWLSTGSFAD